jgi:hypothetical protein
VIFDAFTSDDGVYQPTKATVIAEDVTEAQFTQLAAYLFPHLPHGMGRFKSMDTATLHLYGAHFGERTPNEVAGWLRRHGIGHHTEITHRWSPGDQA